MPRSFLVKKKERHSGLVGDRVPQVAAIAPHHHGDFHGNIEFASKTRLVDGSDRKNDRCDVVCTDRQMSTHQASIRCQGRIQDVNGRYLDEELIAMELKKIEYFRSLETEVESNESTRSRKRKRSKFIQGKYSFIHFNIHSFTSIYLFIFITADMDTPLQYYAIYCIHSTYAICSATRACLLKLMTIRRFTDTI